jgi:Chaperone of endosialidase
MNPIIQLKQITLVFLVAFGLACFALSPAARAVSPAPDGGYAGFNTAEGDNAVMSLTTGQGNTGVGWRSLFANSTNSLNTAIGAGTLVLSTADNNTAVGGLALLLNTTGTANTATGANALTNNVDGNSNTADGYNALNANTHATQNTAIGRGALAFVTTGGSNTALGFQAGNAFTGSESNNIDIGDSVTGVAGESNTMRIGPTSITATHIRGINGAMIAAPAFNVLINSDDQLGTLIMSSKRFKQDIKPMDKASEALFSLQPVTFRYKKEIDPTGRSQFGLVAEEVAKVNPDLIVRDKEGKPASVYYDAVNAMLLNEFLKEHSTVQELKREVAILTATVKEQASQIRKVTAQLELNKPTQTVVNNQ